MRVIANFMLDFAFLTRNWQLITENWSLRAVRGCRTWEWCAQGGRFEVWLSVP